MEIGVLEWSHIVQPIGLIWKARAVATPQVDLCVNRLIDGAYVAYTSFFQEHQEVALLKADFKDAETAKDWLQQYAVPALEVLLKWN